MAEIPEKRPGLSPAFDPLIQTENIAFNPTQMQACAACGRMNPPTRLKCLYCGAGFEISAENAGSIKPVLRKLEPWEQGSNLILLEIVNSENIAAAADLLSMETADLEPIVGTGSPLPIARVEDEREANILITRLDELGLRCSLVNDAALDADKLPVRLSGMEFGKNTIEVTDFNTREITAIESSDLALIVPGVLASVKVESLEKKRRGKTKVLDEVATASDEPVLDIYSRKGAAGFRVHMAGFDFSCLGEEMGMLASENMRRLVVTLKELAPNAKLISEYPKVRHALGGVWEVEARRDPQGLQRSGFGKMEFGSIASTSNLRQFTKYSRLQWHLL